MVGCADMVLSSLSEEYVSQRYSRRHADPSPAYRQLENAVYRALVRDYLD